MVRPRERLVGVSRLDVRESSEPVLAASAVVGLLDPGHDGEPEFFAAVPTVVGDLYDVEAVQPDQHIAAFTSRSDLDMSARDRTP